MGVGTNITCQLYKKEEKRFLLETASLMSQTLLLGTSGFSSWTTCPRQ